MEIQSPIQYFEKRAVFESDQANVIYSAAGGKIDERPLLETNSSDRDHELNADGGGEEGSEVGLRSDSFLRQSDRFAKFSDFWAIINNT